MAMKSEERERSDWRERRKWLKSCEQLLYFVWERDVKPFIWILMNLFMVLRNISLLNFDMSWWLFELGVQNVKNHYE
jgi:hypothetical protein